MWSVDKLRSNSKWTHQITQQVFCEWTHQALSQFWSKCIHNVPEPLIESSFKEYLAIWSQCTQPYTQWVLWEFVIKLNHIESLLWVLWKEPTGYIVGIFLGILWKNSQWVAQAHCGYILIKIVKEPSGFIHKIPAGWFDGFILNLISMYPLITLRSKWWVSFKRTLNLPAGQSVSKLFKNSQKTHNLPARYDPLCLQCVQWSNPYHYMAFKSGGQGSRTFTLLSQPHWAYDLIVVTQPPGQW